MTEHTQYIRLCTTYFFPTFKPILGTIQTLGGRGLAMLNVHKYLTSIHQVYLRFM